MAVPSLPEDFLRYVWQHQMLPPARLVTSDGERVTVRFPGVINRGGGPDFTDASVRIGRTLFRGDVEVHVRMSAWRSHGHSTDPHYNRVILHVVLSCGGDPAPPRTASGRAVPVFVLLPFLTRRLYARWQRESRRESPIPAGCPGKHRLIPLRILRRSVRALGMRRIARRVHVLGTRLRRLIQESESRSGSTWTEEDPAGACAWEQILYECVLEGMGYPGNGASFLSLARAVPLLLLRAHGLSDTRTMQAILFGAAGLLPGNRAMPDPECRAYVRRLRARWQALGPPREIPRLHEADWNFFRLRPVNFPTARLAAFCFLLPSLFSGHVLERIRAALRSPDMMPGERRRVLASLFAVSPDRFWSRHLHFRGRRSGGGIALGRARVQELIVNGIVPLVLLRARVRGDRGLRREALSLLSALPRPAENSVTRLVKGVLPRGAKELRTSLEQQGMLHLYGTCCSRARCSRCPLNGVRT
jgi:hypothetical protein